MLKKSHADVEEAGMKWISFDCFGTLVDWNDGLKAILHDVAGERAADLVRAYHRCEPEVQSEPFRPYRDVTRIALERAAEDIGVQLDSAGRTSIADNWRRIAPFDDTLAALHGLRADGWSVAVLTNCDNDLFAQTQQRIAFDFDRVVTAQEVRSYKPALGHFEKFREITRGDPWVHAACSWFHDIEPAMRLGIRRVWIDRDRTGEDPSTATAVLPDLRKLRDVAAKL